MSAIYVDASYKKGEKHAGVGVYNSDTGLAIGRRIEAVVSRYWQRITLHAELHAIGVAALMEGVTHIITDSKDAVELYKGLKEIPEGVRLTSLPDGCELTWIPREQNLIADWMAKAPMDIELQLAPNLVDLPTPEPAVVELALDLVEAKRQKWIGNLKYTQFLDSATIESVRQADSYMLTRLIDDAKSQDKWIKVNQELKTNIKKLRQTQQEWHNKYQKLNSEYSRLTRELESLKQEYGIDSDG
ncbi:MAG: hypothetical protein KME47_09715 [Nodosilinea sp. WJT8-NPBG4]|nr:hypothetical protein [Nodosilinea sp. WJT8-NPBG4]